MSEVITSNVYLMSAIDYSRNKALKIGFSKDLYGSRKANYRTSGNISDYLGKFHGDFVDELSTQLYYSSYNIEGEIFKYSEDIIQEFKNLSREKIYKYLWNNVDKLFSITDILNVDSRKHKALVRCIKYKSTNLNEIPNTRFGKELRIFIIKNKL